jgi:hypothetical protein
MKLTAPPGVLRFRRGDRMPIRMEIAECARCSRIENRVVMAGIVLLVIWQLSISGWF